MHMFDKKLSFAAVGLATTASIYFGWRYLQRREEEERREVEEPLQESPPVREPSKSAVDFTVLASAVRFSNPQITTVLRYLLEQSAFLEKQRLMDRSGCFTNICVLFSESSNTVIRVLCYKIFVSISTNPALVYRYLEPILSEVDSDLSNRESEYLPLILSLYINFSSMEDAKAFSYHFRTIPQILSRFTHEATEQSEIVLSALKILINMTVAEILFDTSLVFMSSIHLLHSCESPAILLRVLTLIRNIMDCEGLWEDVFEEEIVKGVGVVLTRCPDEQCLELANHVYQGLSVRKD